MQDVYIAFIYPHEKRKLFRRPLIQCVISVLPDDSPAYSVNSFGRVSPFIDMNFKDKNKYE